MSTPKLVPPVHIVPNKTNGNLITTYEGDPNNGYILVEQTKMNVSNGRAFANKRTALIRGDVATLQMILEMRDGSKLPGTIVVREYLQSELPEDIKKSRIKTQRKDGTPVTFNDAIAEHVKRVAEDGPVLTFGGEQILRFRDYVMEPTENDVDIIQEHDNQQAIDAWRASVKASKANLPA